MHRLSLNLKVPTCLIDVDKVVDVYNLNISKQLNEVEKGPIYRSFSLRVAPSLSGPESLPRAGSVFCGPLTFFSAAARLHCVFFRESASRPEQVAIIGAPPCVHLDGYCGGGRKPGPLKGGRRRKRGTNLMTSSELTSKEDKGMLPLLIRLKRF